MLFQLKANLQIIPMNKSLSDCRLANLCAQTIPEAFTRLQEQFQEITDRAHIRFQTRDWSGMQQDAVECLDLYPYDARRRLRIGCT